MKTSSIVEFYIVVLCLVAAIKLCLLGYVLLLLYPYQVGMSNAWPGLLLLTAFLSVTIGCVVCEFRFLKRLRANLNVSPTGAKAAFWLGITPLMLLVGLVVYSING